MGSIKYYRHHGHETADLTGTHGTHGKSVAVLLNSVYYFLQHVFIIIGEDGYRLVVLHNNRILTDSHYDTMRGAKIAFYKMYNRKAWKMGIRANWSRSYNPDRNWLEEKHRMLQTGASQTVH